MNQASIGIVRTNALNVDLVVLSARGQTLANSVSLASVACQMDLAYPLVETLNTMTRHLRHAPIVSILVLDATQSCCVHPVSQNSSS